MLLKVAQRQENNLSFVNLTYTERKALIDGILESDFRYLDKLLARKINLLNELAALEIMIKKKSAEIEGLQIQKKFSETMQ